MSWSGLTWLQIFGLAIPVSTAAIFESENAHAASPEPELSITIVCVDIDSSTYQELQENLESVAQARNCQRGGLSRLELTGVFGTSEIRKLVISLVDARQANVYWFDQVKIRRDRGVDAPIGPWIISQSGSNFVAERGHLELYRGEAAPDLESIGIRAGIYLRRSWPGGGGVPGLHSGPGPDFVKVGPGHTIVIADRPVNWPDSIFLGADDEYKEQLRRRDAEVRTRRLMLIEVPPRIRAAHRSGQTISSPGYATRPRNAAGF